MIFLQESSGIGALGINLPSLLAQLINFTILLIVVGWAIKRFLLPLLDERTKRIQEGLDASEEAKRRLADTEKESAAELEKARREGQELVGQAQQMSARLQEEARASARSEAEQLLERARSEIQLERDAAIADLRREFAGLTITAAERVIRRSLDADAHKELIQEVLADAPTGDGANGGGGGS